MPFDGIAIGALFTLFVVPAMYMFHATDHAKQRVNTVTPDSAPDKT
jgi:hypothetical protein